MTSVTETKTKARSDSEQMLARTLSMLDGAPVNIMFADTNLVLQYMNRASRETLRSLEHLLPVPVDQIEGSIIDIFHKHPEHQRALLTDPSRLPHNAVISLGEEKLELQVSAVNDADGNLIGAMATWEVVTLREAIIESITAASQGDLSTTCMERPDRVFGPIAVGLNLLLSSLREITQPIARNAATLSEAAARLKDVGDRMGLAAEDTTNQATIASGASAEVSDNVASVAGATEEMGASITEIARTAATGAAVAARAVSVAETAGTTIKNLGDSSTQIEKILDVITSIAQQTNLLALNATIEAARAGEAGRGFAVVANEVKDLAKETAKATEDIAGRIATIQNDATSAISTITDISTIIDEINDVQNTIATAVEEQAATTAEIARSVSEAAAGSLAISDTINHVAQAAGVTVEGVHETRDAAGALGDMASELQELVQRFTH